MSIVDVFFDLFRPRHKSRRSWIRAGALKNISDQKILFEMYKNEPANGLQKIIIAKITDQDSLAAIVNENNAHSLQAAGNLTLQDYLKRFIKHPNTEIRRTIIEKIDPVESEFFKQLFETEKDAQIRSILLNGMPIKEQELFRNIAKSEENPNLRIAAIEKIDDSQFLESLLENKPPRVIIKNIKTRVNSLRILEVSKIKDQKELRSIFFGETLPDIKTAVLKNINDIDIVFEIILNDKAFGEDALKKITGEENFLKIALDKQVDYSLRDAAYKRLRKEKSFALIAAKGGILNFCFEAVAKVNSPDLLAMVLAEGDPMISCKTVPKLPEKMLPELYRHNDRYIRSAVIEKTSDQNILETAAMEDKEAAIRQSAILKITDSKIRRHIKATSTDDVVKEIAGLPLKGTCSNCENKISINRCEIRTISGDYRIMHFFYCPDCYKNNSKNIHSGRIVDGDGKDIMYSTPGGEWG